jgi:hypothetical protein
VATVTDLVSRLLEAITAKEEKARAASPSPWALHRDSLGDDHWADISAADGSSPVDTESGAIGPNLATVEFIADNDPSSVLRRCAADRRRAERHAPSAPGIGPFESRRFKDPDALICTHCSHDGDWGATVWPCPDFTDLVDSYGLSDHQEGEE